MYDLGRVHLKYFRGNKGIKQKMFADRSQRSKDIYISTILRNFLPYNWSISFDVRMTS